MFQPLRDSGPKGQTRRKWVLEVLTPIVPGTYLCSEYMEGWMDVE